MGTPDFATPVLDALLEADHDVAAVFTKPDRRRGRTRRQQHPSVETYALGDGLPVHQPVSLHGPEALRLIAGLEPDLIVVAAYGLLLPAAVLDLPKLKTLNVHPSMLPAHRGAAPVSQAILDGSETTGVTIMVLDEGLDSGPIVVQEETAIGGDEDAAALTRRLFEIGGRLLVDTLPRWERGEIEALEQDDSLATITRRLTRDDGRIDWSRPASYLARKVRAHTPWPGSFAHWRGRVLKVISASVQCESGAGTPGQVLAIDGGAAVGTGCGLLALHKVQLEGRRPMKIDEFLRGHSVFIGAALG